MKDVKLGQPRLRQVLTEASSLVDTAATSAAPTPLPSLDSFILNYKRQRSEPVNRQVELVSKEQNSNRMVHGTNLKQTE